MPASAMKSTKKHMFFLMLSSLLSLSACAAGSGCSWARRIIVAEEDLLTRSTKEQIVAHNRGVEEFCR